MPNGLSGLLRHRVEYKLTLQSGINSLLAGIWQAKGQK